MADDVKDIDLGWSAMRRATAAADGLELRVGVLDSAIRYPKTAGGKPGQQVAKVGMIHGLHRAISQGYEDSRANTDAAFDAVHAELLAGRSAGIADMIYQRMGVPLRDRMRSLVYSYVTRRSGRMAEAVRATVFENAKISRGSASAGTVAAGDDPKRPRATDQVGG